MIDRSTRATTFGAVPAALMSLINAELELGADLMRSFTGLPVPSVADALRASRTRFTQTCCRIPPPCWMPRSLGECVSNVGQCKTACIRIVVTNCDDVRRTIKVSAGDKPGDIKISPASLDLGSMERGVVSVCLTIPQDTPDGTRIESLIWVHGCKASFLRWTVSVGTIGFDSCHEVAVDDCPDLIHHWYDHFYCVRHCDDRRNSTSADVHG
jgi:hypothetical protein